MQYQIRNAQWEDLGRIKDIYAYARAFMAQTGNPNQWGKTTPAVSLLEEDIREQRLYVAEENGVITEVCAANGQVVEYGTELFRIRKG